MSRRKTAPHPVDVNVGKTLRRLRQKRGMSQSKLAEASRITFQQVQKYEKATNRVSASRLSEFARVLDVPVAMFFEEQD